MASSLKGCHHESQAVELEGRELMLGGRDRPGIVLKIDADLGSLPNTESQWIIRSAYGNA